MSASRACLASATGRRGRPRCWATPQRGPALGAASRQTRTTFSSGPVASSGRCWPFFQSYSVGPADPYTEGTRPRRSSGKAPSTPSTVSPAAASSAVKAVPKSAWRAERLGGIGLRSPGATWAIRSSFAGRCPDASDLTDTGQTAHHERHNTRRWPAGGGSDHRAGQTAARPTTPRPPAHRGPAFMSPPTLQPGCYRHLPLKPCRQGQTLGVTLIVVQRGALSVKLAYRLVRVGWMPHGITIAAWPGPGPSAGAPPGIHRLSRQQCCPLLVSSKSELYSPQTCRRPPTSTTAAP